MNKEKDFKIPKRLVISFIVAIIVTVFIVIQGITNGTELLAGLITYVYLMLELKGEI